MDRFLSVWTSDALRDSAIGFVSSGIAVAATYPADTLSRRQQVSAKKTPMFSSKGLFKGLGPALGTQPVYWAINFPIYKAFKDQVSHTSVYQNNPFISSMAIGFTSGAVATVATNPLWMLRQRMQTEVMKGKTNNYSNLIRELYREDGVRTFFRGTSLTLVKNIQMALLLPIFERLNASDSWSYMGVPTMVAAAASGAVAKIVSSTGLYPLDVIRTNMRYIEGQKAPFIGVTRDIIRRPGGFSNLFRGIGWYWASAAGTFAVMMGIQSVLKGKE